MIEGITGYLLRSFDFHVSSCYLTARGTGTYLWKRDWWVFAEEKECGELRRTSYLYAFLCVSEEA